MRVVVADRSLERFAQELEAAGPDATWSYHGPDEEEALATALADADAFVGSRLPAHLASAGSRLGFVQAAGAGVDAIDLAALSDSVTVANVFEHERSIAEHVLMAVLALQRGLLPADQALRRGHWLNPARDPSLPLSRTLTGQRVGIVGYGHIGREIARLTHALGMRPQAVRRCKRREPDEWLESLGGPEDLPDLLASSDVVVVCVPLSEETRDLIGREELALMRPDAYLVNVARGAVVVEEALYAALRDRVIAGAALDVWWRPPPVPGQVDLPASLPFAELDNVVFTPHVSGVTEETFRRRAREIGANLARFASGQDVRHRVR